MVHFYSQAHKLQIFKDDFTHNQRTCISQQSSHDLGSYQCCLFNSSNCKMMPKCLLNQAYFFRLSQKINHLTNSTTTQKYFVLCKIWQSCLQDRELLQGSPFGSRSSTKNEEKCVETFQKYALYINCINNFYHSSLMTIHPEISKVVTIFEQHAFPRKINQNKQYDDNNVKIDQILMCQHPKQLQMIANIFFDKPIAQRPQKNHQNLRINKKLRYKGQNFQEEGLSRPYLKTYINCRRFVLGKVFISPFLQK